MLRRALDALLARPPAEQEGDWLSPLIRTAPFADLVECANRDDLEPHHYILLAERFATQRAESETETYEGWYFAMLLLDDPKTPEEALRTIAKRADSTLLLMLAGRNDIPDDLALELAAHPLYAIPAAIVANPATSDDARTIATLNLGANQT
jgi:hypothetical protein